MADKVKKCLYEVREMTKRLTSTEYGRDLDKKVEKLEYLMDDALIFMVQEPKPGEVRER